MYFDRYMLFSGFIEEIYKTVERIRTERMASFGLHSADVRCIIALHAHPDGLTVTELASLCKVDKAAVSRAVRALLEADAITYANKEKKNYRTRLVLTESGKSIADEMNGMAKDAVEAATSGLRREELEELYKTLGTMCQNLKKYAKGLES